MKYFIIVGLGNFSIYLLEELKKYKSKVAIIDKDEKRIKSVEMLADEAIVADISDKSVLEEIDVKSADAVVINLGEKGIEQSIFLCLWLQEKGVENIIVKVTSEEQEKALRKIGIKNIIFPERDAVKALARTLISGGKIEDIFEYGNFMLIEMKPPKAILGKTLEESDVKNKYGIYIAAVKNENGFLINPPANYRIKENDIIFVFGERENIEKFTKLK